MTENTEYDQKSDVAQHHSNYKKFSYYTPEDIIEKESQNIILSNMLLTWAGCYVKAYGHYIYHRQLPDYAMIYCIDGQGWLDLGGRQFTIKKGDLFVCPPEMLHSYGADSKDPWTKYWIHFRGRDAAEYASLMGVTAESPVIHLGDNRKILTMIQDIFSVLKTGYTHSNLLLATSYLTSICSYINNCSMNHSLTNTSGINVEQIIHYMLDHINTNLELEQLADYAGISKYHFTKLFKEKTGYTPIDYYIRLKIQKACELLELSNTTINSISVMIGFSSPYYFSLTFKRIIGVAPQYYRKQHMK